MVTGTASGDLLARSLPIGVTLIGVVHTDRDVFDLETRFRMVREAGVFDYVERIPAPAEVDEYLRLSKIYAMPIRSCGWYYTLHRDEPLLEWHVRICALLNARALNVQVRTISALGKPVSDEEIAGFYLRASEQGEAAGVDIALEVHVNMWSEHFGRVARVGKLVEARGVPFHITLDHSHVIFKIHNPVEQRVQNMKADIDAGTLVLDPALPGNVCDAWIASNYVSHAHARSTIPANPVNIAAKHPDGSFGRGIQYPFIPPAQGEWHAPWSEEKLEPWKSVVRKLFRHHLTDRDSPLGQITTEFIPFPDYGAGASYSIFNNNVACAKWLRTTLDQTRSQLATAAER